MAKENSMSDPDVQRLAKISQSLEKTYIEEGENPWSGSPFEWIKKEPSGRVGKIGEKLLSKLCESQGLRVQKSHNSQWDRTIEGHKVEIKCSSLWKSGGYKFQQIRNQDYEFLACLGISPFDAHLWVITKHLAMEKWDSGEISSQHKGSEGKDTAWFTVNPANPQPWLTPQGGRLKDAIELLRGN